MHPAIVALEGPTLSAPERAMLAARPPAGVILFARNIETPPQLAALVASLRAVLDPDAALMLDQEGGRVARLRPPHWRAHPPAAAIGALWPRDPAAATRAAFLHGAAIGAEAREAGFDILTAPVLDLAVPGASDVIGDRAFGPDPNQVATLGRAMAEGLLAGGIVPVMKHLPGHGRARIDSHLALPTVTDLTEADLRPFILNAARPRGIPWAMTAHIRYPAWDPDRPASLSPIVIGDVIRRRIGFQGVLVTDDLAMGALSGPPEARARAALAAGADLALFCAPDRAATEALLEACPAMGEAARARLAAGRDRAAAARTALDPAALADERDRLLA